EARHCPRRGPLLVGSRRRACDQGRQFLRDGPGLVTEAPEAPALRCSNCGAEIRPGMPFCGICGHTAGALAPVREFEAAPVATLESSAAADAGPGSDEFALPAGDPAQTLPRTPPRH